MNNKTKLILLLFILFEVLTLLNSMNRGFDITDEGFYLLSFQSNYQNDVEFSKSNEVVKMLTGNHDIDIFDARLLRLILSIISSIIFSSSFYVLIKKTDPFITKKYNLLTMNLIFLVGILGSYSFNPQSISYNSLSLFLAILITSLLFLHLLLKINGNGRFTQIILIILKGALFGLYFYVKFTSAISLFFVICLVMAFINGKAFRKTLVYCVMLLFSFLSSIVLIGVFNQNLKIFYTSLIDMISNSGYYSSDIGFFHQLATLVSFFLKLVASVVIGISLGYAYLRLAASKIEMTIRYIKYSRLISFSFVLVILTSVISVFYAEVIDFNNFSLEILLTVICFFLTLAKQASGDELGISKTKMIILVLLAVLPLTVTFGTWLPFMSHLLLSVIFICAIPVFFLNNKTTSIISSLYLAIAGILLIFVINNNYLQPYRMSAINKYTTKIGLNDIVTERISFLPEEAGDLQAMVKILKENGYKKGDYLISAYRIPGLVYLLGGTQPGGTLWGNESERRYLDRLRSINDNILKKTILITRKDLSAEFIELLKEKSINFPQDYRVYGGLSYGTSEKETITIYVPAKLKDQ